MEVQQALYPNITLFVQAFLFLIFLFIIRQVLVKPYSAVIEERESITAKNYEDAKKLQEEASKFFELAKEELEKASLTSKGDIKLRQEGSGKGQGRKDRTGRKRKPKRK
jgi:F-type H+-transporting ATPase subunit b